MDKIFLKDGPYRVLTRVRRATGTLRLERSSSLGSENRSSAGIREPGFQSSLLRLWESLCFFYHYYQIPVTTGSAYFIK